MDSLKNPWIIGGVAIGGVLLLMRGGNSGGAAPDYTGAALQSQSIATAQNTTLGVENIRGYTQKALAGIQAGSNRDDILSHAVQARMMHETDLIDSVFRMTGHAADVAAQTHQMDTTFITNLTANTAYFRAQEARANADAKIAQKEINAQTRNAAINAGGGILSSLIGLFK